MPTVQQTITRIIDAATWDQRIAQIRLVPTNHGTAEHSAIFAAVARRIYVPHLAPDFAYINEVLFYDRAYFEEVYNSAATATAGFVRVSDTELAEIIQSDPRTLLVFRTIMGFVKEEFAHSTALAIEGTNLAPLSAGKVDSMERNGTAITQDQARVAAITLSRIMDGTLFGAPPGALRTKQAKPDTENAWASVRDFAAQRVPFALFLHQRHYGGAYRQVLDATSTLRGNLIEEAVEALFQSHHIAYIRTGAHNQAEIAARFEVTVTPAPDFVVFDGSDTLRAILECKGANDGGTARDKALRFRRLHDESVRLGGIPLIAVLGGMGWTRVNDTLGPVVRDTDGRVFTLANLADMLTVAPFPSLINTA